jgi:hypothetical protein
LPCRMPGTAHTDKACQFPSPTPLPAHRPGRHVASCACVSRSAYCFGVDCFTNTHQWSAEVSCQPKASPTRLHLYFNPGMHATCFCFFFAVPSSSQAWCTSTPSSRRWSACPLGSGAPASRPNPHVWHQQRAVVWGQVRRLLCTGLSQFQRLAHKPGRHLYM